MVKHIALITKYFIENDTWFV